MKTDKRPVVTVFQDCGEYPLNRHCKPSNVPMWRRNSERILGVWMENLPRLEMTGDYGVHRVWIPKLTS